MVPPARPDSLPLIEAACWAGLAEAAAGRSHEWRTLVLATIDGDRADARTVMLREVDPESRVLVFFTDSRSPKVSQIGLRPRGTLLAWSPAINWQLRIGVVLHVETDGPGVSTRWARLKLTPNVDDYLAPLAPGTPIVHRATDRASRAHFGVVAAEVESIDWLELHTDGHRRARFDAGGARWLQP